MSKWVLRRPRLPPVVITLTQSPTEGSCGPFKVVGGGPLVGVLLVAELRVLVLKPLCLAPS